MEENGPFVIKWEQHSEKIRSAFVHYLSDASFSDVVLCSEGTFLPCHKIVLAATSKYFENIFKSNMFSDSRDRPVIVFNDIKMADLCAVLNYMYSGTVEIPQHQIQSFLNTAFFLKVKGVCEKEQQIQAEPRIQIENVEILENVMEKEKSVEDPAKNPAVLTEIPTPDPSPPNRISQVFFGHPSDQDSFIKFDPPNLSPVKFSMTAMELTSQEFKLSPDILNPPVQVSRTSVVPVAHKNITKRKVKAPSYLASFQVENSVVDQVSECQYCGVDTSNMPGASKVKKRFNHENRCEKNTEKNAGKSECPLCTKFIATGYLPTHMKQVHKISSSTLNKTAI